MVENVIGVDVGGTKILAGLVARDGTVHSHREHATPLESEAAQLRVRELFQADFLHRYPDGIVISELEYMGRTTSAPNQPGPLRIAGRPALNRIMEALTADFRRWLKDRDYRKCDVLGIAGDGSVADAVKPAALPATAEVGRPMLGVGATLVTVTTMVSVEMPPWPSLTLSVTV